MKMGRDVNNNEKHQNKKTKMRKGKMIVIDPVRLHGSHPALKILTRTNSMHSPKSRVAVIVRMTVVRHPIVVVVVAD